MENGLEKTNAWKYLDESMRDLMAESYALLEQEQGRLRQGSGEPRHDYSFIVFPAAKAFEGFLKKVFLDLGFITKSQYNGDRFRIGRALNPDLPVRYRWDWVYAKIAARCGGETLPLELWQVWKTARNSIFHFFPGHARFISIEEARALVAGVTETMDKTLEGCGLA